MEIKKVIKKNIINISSCFCRLRKSKCLFYHDIHSDKRFTEMSTSLDVFESHVKIIRKNGFDIVHEITEQEKQIEISFDDGFKGVYENIQIINRLEIPITIFVVTSFIGKENFLTSQQIQELIKNPFVRIESHSHTHVDLTLLSINELEIEISKSKNILQEICKKEINSLSYPKGFFNKNVITFAENFYTKQYSSVPGNYYNEDFLSVKKRSLVQFSSEKEFQNILIGGDHILSLWYKLKHFKK